MEETYGHFSSRMKFSSMNGIDVSKQQAAFEAVRSKTVFRLYRGIQREFEHRVKQIELAEKLKMAKFENETFSMLSRQDELRKIKTTMKRCTTELERKDVINNRNFLSRKDVLCSACKLGHCVQHPELGELRYMSQLTSKDSLNLSDRPQGEWNGRSLTVNASSCNKCVAGKLNGKNFNQRKPPCDIKFVQRNRVQGAQKSPSCVSAECPDVGTTQPKLDTEDDIMELRRRMRRRMLADLESRHRQLEKNVQTFYMPKSLA